MATSYTADALLEDVRRGASASSTAATGQADADLLAHADAELRDTLVPLVLGVMEEFYERPFDQTITSGVASYRINKRAALSRVNSVQLINTGSSPNYNLQRIEPKQSLDLSSIPANGQPWAYYLEGGRIVLFPTPVATATLRIRAMVRPSRLVLTTDATNVFAITGVSTGASTYTTTTAAHGVSVSAARDLVSGTPSFEHLAVDATFTTVTTTTGTFAITDCTTAPAIGDYLCLPDYTPMIQLPVELHPALVELTVTRLLRARGVTSEAADHLQAAQRMIATGIQALTPRVDTAGRKIVGGPHFRRRGFGVLRGF